MTPAALRQLAALAEARRVRDLARLDGLLAEDRELLAAVAALAGTAARDLADGVAVPVAHQGLRQAWADQRIRMARRRRAELAPRIRAARAEAVQSLGKHRALEKLVEQADGAAEQLRIARAEREAPLPLARNQGAAG